MNTYILKNTKNNAPDQAGAVATSPKPVVDRLRCTKWDDCKAILKDENNDGCFIAGSRGGFYRCYERPANASDADRRYSPCGGCSPESTSDYAACEGCKFNPDNPNKKFFNLLLKWEKETTKLMKNPSNVKLKEKCDIIFKKCEELYQKT